MIMIYHHHVRSSRYTSFIRMDEERTKGRLALERNLQKGFKTVQSFFDRLQTVLAETWPLVTSVSNLLEQLECCKSVDNESLPIIDKFPDVKARLITRIEYEIVQNLEKLENMIDFLKEKHEVMRKHCECSATLVQKYAADFDFSTFSKEYSTVPSLGNMIELLENISLQLEEQYLCKHHLLKTLLTEEGVNSHCFLLNWQDQDEALFNTIKDCLSRVECFLDEKR